MPQYIDVDALVRLMNEKHKHLVDETGWYDHYTSGYEDAITDVEEAPTVDVAPVVRCKDCDMAVESGKGYLICVEWGRPTDFEGFCHKGERRGDEP